MQLTEGVEKTLDAARFPEFKHIQLLDGSYANHTSINARGKNVAAPPMSAASGYNLVYPLTISITDGRRRRRRYRHNKFVNSSVGVSAILPL